ncbi:MAG: adenine phosphoribosyltransferase [Nitrososphaeraceae archaeon]
MNNQKIDLKELIKDYQDFPKKGVVFRDINPLFRNENAILQISKEFIQQDQLNEIDLIAGIESRGFTVASLLAANFKKGLILIRKAGKLPGKTVQTDYDIEYGSATIELQTDAIKRGQRVLIADDLIATGGTAIASAKLIEKLGGIVFGFAFIIELEYLQGVKKLKDLGYNVKSLVKYNE